MPELFGREARIVVGAGIGGVRAGIRVDSHRCAFKVEKTLKPEPNTCTLQVWNLSAEQRGQIEELRPKKGDKTGVPVLIEAGYVTSEPSQIFLGDMRTVYSTKEGPDWITTLESGDGEKAIQTARINLSFGPKTSTETVLRAIVKALGVKPGNVSQAASLLRSKGFASFPAGKVVSGSAAVHMTNFCKSADLEWSIQDGAIQIVDRGKALSKFAVRLSSTTGLIESPTVDHKGVLSAKFLIQPDIRPGSKLVLDSLSVRGNYRITKCVYDGDTFGNAWEITVEGERY
jgi:baseplate hub protein gp41